MVSFLILVEALNVIGSDIARPLQVKEVVRLFEHDQASILARGHDSVVDMSCLCNLE